MTPSPAPRTRLTTLLAGPEPEFDLAEAALLIAAEFQPEIEIQSYLAQLDVMGRDARARFATRARTPTTALAEYLFGELGFRGNSEQYYDPRNSFLNDVLDRRLGIPITLSTVYLEVGRRAGLDVEGVGLPGHFLVRVRDAEASALIDPYHGGVELSEADCQRRLDRVFDGRVRLAPHMLARSTPTEILARMLRNLKAIFLRGEDGERALPVLDLLLLIDSESVEDLLDRGLLYERLHCYHLAAADLERLLSLPSGPSDPEAILDKVVALRRKARQLN